MVDDYTTIRKKLCSILEKFSSKIVEASNGVEALEILRREQFDIVFTDIVMPEMDGFELCYEIRKTPTFFDLPIIAVSTHCDAAYIVKALRQGASDYIPKPADPQVVEKVLKRVFFKLPV